MRALLVRLISRFRRWSLRRRLGGLAAALLINALLLLMLLTLAPDVAGLKSDKDGLMTFTVEPPAPPAPEKSAVQPTVHAQARAAPPPVPPPPVPVTPPVDVGLIQLSHDELAQVDTAMRAPPVQRPSRDGSVSDTEMAGESGTPVAQGTGPHGETLYRAEWYREPTDAELRTYLPSSIMLGSYGAIACRTAPRYHVEDCVPLDESPAGSGLSRAIVNAAWQFLVLPPRRGGKALVGEWVRITILFNKDGKDRSRGR